MFDFFFTNEQLLLRIAECLPVASKNDISYLVCTQVVVPICKYCLT